MLVEKLAGDIRTFLKSINLVNKVSVTIEKPEALKKVRQLK